MTTTSKSIDLGRSDPPVFPAFMAPGAQIFLALVSGWVLCIARRMITPASSPLPIWTVGMLTMPFTALPDAR
ncbi:MAG TPA: hypothetical protein PLT20_01205 [Sedimentisphaerales bacterium]|nr:hypothetical protein [Sedimentisphaerales bacterium]